MIHFFQVGVGSGGMAVLDLLAREERLSRITLVEPDLYQPHNVVRHLFPPSAVGRPKGELAREWLLERRPDLEVQLLAVDLTDPMAQAALEAALASADLGICAVDNEPAKYHFDALLRRHRKPWTLGEVLSGGIGGFVHVFTPQGPCYGCVASYLQRSVTVDISPSPPYSVNAGPVPEAMIPAGRTAIHAIASLHALRTLELLNRLEEVRASRWAPTFTTLLFSLQAVPGVFEQPFQTYRFPIVRESNCLICQIPSFSATTQQEADDLDAALHRALARLGPKSDSSRHSDEPTT